MKLKKWLALFLAIIVFVNLSACKNGAPGKETADDKLVTVYLLTELSYSGETWTVEYDKGGRLQKVIGSVLGQRFEHTENGQITVYYTAGDTALSACEYHFDESGNLTQAVTVSDGEAVTPYRTEYQYDEKGNLAKLIQYEDGKALSCTEYQYDENGTLIQTVYTSTEKTVSHNRIVYDYDDQARLTKKALYDDNGYWLPYKILYTYDAQGNLIRVGKHAEGQPIFQWTYEDGVATGTYTPGTIDETVLKYKQFRMDEALLKTYKTFSPLSFSYPFYLCSSCADGYDK